MNENTSLTIIGTVIAVLFFIFIFRCQNYEKETRTMRLGYEQSVDKETGNIIWVKVRD